MNAIKHFLAMSIPKFDETMLPILRVLADGQVKNLREVSEELENKYFDLTDEEKKETVSNGYSRFFDRIGWGRTYLKKAGLIEQPEKGMVRITPEGLRVLSLNLESISVDFLSKYPSFVIFKSSGRDKSKEEAAKVVSEKFSPQDLIDIGFRDTQETLKSDLLEKLQSTNPYFFEKVVLQLFQKMGYGDFQETPKSGDGGVDGIISQDKLGLEKIYIQAKRYSTNVVREPEIRNFIGAMSGDVSKGIFATTSTFHELAKEKANKAYNHKIILIDGEQLTDLMIKYNVGVQIKASYEVKEMDNDFFELVK